jgi:hypothetical protein
MIYYSVTTLFLGMNADQPKNKKEKGNGSNLYQQEFRTPKNINY